MKRKRLLLSGALLLFAFSSTGCIYHGHGGHRGHRHHSPPPCGPYLELLAEFCPPPQ